MVEAYLIIIGLVFFAWLLALVWQTRRGLEADRDIAPRPFVPVNLPEVDEAIIVSERRGRIVYANEHARRWFGLDGGSPNLAVMAQRVRPVDTLHDLLASPGHASLRVGQRQVEAVSHTIPGPDGERMVLILRELTPETLGSATDFDPLRALTILENVSQAVGAGLALDATVDAILSGLEHAVAFDSAEITLAQPDQDDQHPAGRGLVRGTLGRLVPYDEAQDTTVALGQGYTGWLATYRQPLLIDDVSARTDIQPQAQGNFLSYLGVPLLIGDRFVGTLELMHRERGAFSHRDLALVEAVSGQIAAALQAVRYAHDQTRRLSELGGLQQIADVIGDIHDPHQMYRQLTQRIADLAQVEVCGILVFNPGDGMFHSRPPFHGVPEALLAEYRVPLVPGSELDDIWRNRPWWYSNTPDENMIQAVGLQVLAGPLELRSLGIVPLGAGTQRTGLLLVANKRQGRAFDDPDMQSLVSFASQASVVLENARLYEEQQRHARELGGLQQIAQAIGALRSLPALIEQITSRIAGLLDVEVCGILLYDSSAQVLVSQQPFFGMDDEQVRFYEVPSPPESPVARLWQARDTWYSNDLRNDPEAMNTDLATLAIEVGMRQTAIATLMIGDNRLGIIQVANRRDGRDFSDADARLLSILAGQAAVLIDNARLYREMQRRTHEAEGLRAVTEIASQGVPTPETIEAVLIAVANLLETQVVVISLVDEATGELVIEPGYVWGGALDEPYRINAFAPGFEHSVLVSRQPFISLDLRADERVLPDYRPLIERFGLTNCIQVPLVVQNRCIGEMVAGNRTSGEPFDEAHADLLLAIGRQVAAMIDRMRMMEATDHDLRARVQELNALTRVTRELSRTLELDHVLNVIRQEALRSTNASAASILLLADPAEWDADDEPVIEQRFGEGRVLRDLASVERAAILRNDVLLVADYGSSEFDPHPENARSALVVPVTLGDQVTGLIHLFSSEPDTFEQGAVDFVVSLTDHATVAIANARRYQEQIEANQALRVRTERMGRIFELGELFRRGASLPELLEEVAHSVQETVGFNVVLISVVDERAGVLRRTAQAGLPLAAFEEMRQISPPLEQAYSLMQDQYRVSNSYFLPAEGAEDLTAGLPTYAVLQERSGKGPRAWDPDDLLLIPLYGAGGRVLGIMSVDDPQSGRRPTPTTVEALEIFANQAAFSIENYRLVERIQQEAEATRRERDRLAQLHLVASRIQSAQDMPSRMQVVADGIHEAGWGHVVITLRDEHLEPTTLVHAGYTPEEAGGLAGDVLPGKVWRAWLNDLAFHELKLGAGYYLRYNHPWVREHVFEGEIPDPPVVDEDAWHPQDKLILPLIGQDQQRIIGIIEMDSPADGRVPTEASLQPFELFALQAAVAIETTRLYQETQDRAATLRAQAHRLETLNRMSTRLAQTLEAKEIYRIIIEELQSELGCQSGGLMLIQPDNTGRLVLSTHPMDANQPDLTVPIQGNPIAEAIISTRQPVVIEDVETDERLAFMREIQLARNTRAMLITPLIMGDTVIGTIGLDTSEPRVFSAEEIDLAVTAANQAAVAIEKARLYDETLGLTIFNQAVVESIQQGIVVLDDDLTIRRINRTMVARHGWEARVVGQPLFDVRPELAGFLREPVSVALEKGEPQVRYKVERRGDDGVPAVHNYYIYPLREGRQVTGIVLLIEDVTERARLEADLEARAAQMAALSEVSTQITATLEPDQVIGLILDALEQVVPYDGVSLWLRTPGEEELRIVAARGYADPGATNVDALIGETVEISYSPLFREMAAQKQVINVGDVSAGDERFPGGGEAIYKNWLGAPLISKGAVVGVIALEKREANYYTSLHEQLALTFASQAAVALDNAQLFQETRARALALDEQAQRLALLNRVSLALAQTLDLENIFEIALREAAISLGIDEGAALQIDPVENLCSVIVEYPRGDAPPTLTFAADGNSAVQRVCEDLIPVVVECNENDPLYADLRSMLRRPDVQRSLLVPLVVGGQVIGILRLDAVSDAWQFPAAQIELAQTIASQAAIAVQNASLFEQTALRTRELETLFESAQATAVTLDLDEVVRRVTVQMLSALNADACTVFLWDDVNNTLTVRGELSARPSEVESDHPGDVYPVIDFPLRERALRDRELIVIRADDAAVPPGERALLERHAAASRLLIPLVVNEISIGLVEIELLDPARQFKPGALRLARALGSQAAISIENARLQTETRRTVEELYIINEMSGALSSADNLDELLLVIDTQLPSLTDPQFLYVALYDAESETLSFPLATNVMTDEPVNLPPRPLGDDEFSLVVRQKTPLLLAGENLDAVRRSLKIETIMPEAKCFLGVPLFAGDDVIGVLAVRDDDDPLAFTHNDQRILNTVGAQLGIAIQSTRLFQQTLELAAVLEQRVRERTAELEQERQHIATLYAITTELATSLDMDRLLNSALEMVARAVGATQGAILALDPMSSRLFFRARLGWPELPVPEGEEEPSLALDEGLAGWAILNKQSIVVDNVQNDPRWLRLDEADDVPRAAMVALIETNEDVLGVAMLYSDRPGAFTGEHLRLVTAAAHQVANAMNNAELYSLIRDQAERLGAMLRQEQVEATKNAAILDSVADGVMVADENGEIIVFNTTASRILGLPVEQVLGRTTSDVAGLFGAGKTRWTQTVQRWMDDPASYEPGEFFEDRLVLDDYRVISVRVSPVSMGDQFLGTVSIFRDITREVEVDRLKNEFVATVSHELRTPMTSIKGYADLLLLGAAGEMSEPQRRFLETIKQNADRLSILVNDLLDISRIDQGRMELRFNTVDVENVINSVAVHLRGRSEDEKREMHVITRLPDDRRLTVWGDHDKVAQILTNLADNAFNYTPEGGTITLAATADDEAGHVTLSVVDTGIGIPPEVADRVFERFFRGDEIHELVMDTPGTGLGLAIVRELVEVHRGRIWFESEVGQGTTFYVELPSQAPSTELTETAEQPAGE